MRSVADRVRHAVCFEIIGVIIIGPLAGWLFDAALYRVGALAVALSMIATSWNYLYNVWFDHAMRRLRGRIYKNLAERVLHAFLFEFGMLVLTVPVVMWWMEYGILRTLNMSLSLMVFYLVYTYVYNLAYDNLFPVPEPAEAGHEGCY